MRLITTCHLDFQIDVPTPFILMLRPRSGAGQWVAREEYELIPMVEALEFTDELGNLCQRLVAPPGPFCIRTSAEVETADVMDVAPGAPFVEIQQLPLPALRYLLPSRYCEADRFGQMASELTVGQFAGYNQVAAINNWVKDHVSYIPGSGEGPVSAAEVNTRRSGVCLDLAHLGIALCRALSIPARLAVGYLYQLQPMDLHAWFEAYVGGRWYTFDPTQSALRGGYVPIGYGRDAADVAVYNQFGPPVYPTATRVTVELC
jgi:transglutaminase-like putative cysteine protease